MTLVRGPNRELLEVSAIAEEAFVLAYPLVLASRIAKRAPVNELVFGRDMPDVLRLAGRLDLAAEPLVLSLPATHGRYYVLWLRDAWNHVFASIGPRTTGTASRAFALTGPGRHDLELGSGLTTIEAPTRMISIAGCVEAVGEPDDQVRDGFALAPLSAWHGTNRPAGGRTGPAFDASAAEIERMEARTFFAEVAQLVPDNPPDLAGRAILDRLLAVMAGEALNLGPDLELGVRRGRDAIRTEAERPLGEAVGRWRVRYESDRHGADHLRRAGAARSGLHVDPPADILVARLDADDDGRPLTGRSRYRLRFAPDASPPTDGFWSLTTRAGDSVHSIGDLNGLTLDRDGSLPIHIQAGPPARRRRSNWLPTPAGEFSLALHLYWPRIEVLERQWSPPPVKRVD